MLQLPKPDAKGNYPAVEYGCAGIARSIIRDRVKAGLNQKQLAKLAGIRVETLCRIETGRHLPSLASVEKIDKSLKRALAKNRSFCIDRPSPIRRNVLESGR